jgi:hypothetical protein
MAVEDAFRAMRECTKVVAEAADMASAGATGKVLEETIKHAEELLTIIDEELTQFDPTGQVAARTGARRNCGESWRACGTNTRSARSAIHGKAPAKCHGENGPSLGFR